MYVFKNSKSTFSGWTIPEGCVEISDEDYKKLVDDELMWNDKGKLVSNPNYATIKAERDAKELELQKLNQINSLKAQLAATDFKALKWAEGYYTEEEYAPIKATREELRNQIRNLLGE